jgi:hypothetical protein
VTVVPVTGVPVTGVLPWLLRVTAVVAQTRNQGPAKAGPWLQGTPQMVVLWDYLRTECANRSRDGLEDICGVPPG